MDVTGFDELTTVTSHQAVGSVVDAQALAGGGPQFAVGVFEVMHARIGSHDRF